MAIFQSDLISRWNNLGNFADICVFPKLNANVGGYVMCFYKQNRLFLNEPINEYECKPQILGVSEIEEPTRTRFLFIENNSYAFDV